MSLIEGVNRVVNRAKLHARALSMESPELDFAEAKQSVILEQLLALHGGVETDCGRWSQDGKSIQSCMKCTLFTIDWSAAAGQRPGLKGLKPRMPE